MVPARTLMPMLRRGALAALLLALSGCGDDRAAREAQARREAEAQRAFAIEQQAWRAQRRASLLKPDGWPSVIGLHWLEERAHYVGSDADNGIRITMGPEHLGMIERKGGAIRFVPESGVPLTLNGEPLAGAVTLATDADPAGPSVIGFDDGKGQALVIRRGDRYALRVKHADAPTRTGFGGLEYWPASRAWRIEGRFVPHPLGRTIPVVDITGNTIAMKNPGAVEFERDGRRFRLEALDDGGGELFLIYADRTNGHGSYGAGRYLYAPLPDARGRVVLDFNRGYNPPCAFTAFATCPLPPPENRLDLAITAGERIYRAPSSPRH